MDWLAVISQPSATQLTALALSTIVVVDAAQRYIRNRNERNGHSMPPGPTPFPLLGSALSINAQEPWLTYTAWRSKYGNVVYAKLLNTDVIVLNTYADAIELLEKRSQIYSDRPFIATIEPMDVSYGHGENIGFIRYGPHWRLARRIIHQTFHAEAARAFRPMQLCRAREIIIKTVEDPNEYSSYYSTFGAAVAMSTVYDYEPEAQGDPLVKLTDDFCEASIPSLTPEMAVILKAFPFVLSIPEWIPTLSRIRRQATKANNLGIQVLNRPYQSVKNRMAAKEHIVANTMVFDHIRRMERLDNTYRAQYEKALKGAALTSVLGAAETTAATLLTFTLAMVKNPRVWKQAQAEIDTVIGTDRLPEFEDRPSLPYVEAILRESLRWIPVAPLGVPHAVVADDIYKGYYIPRGATIIANIWGMSRDETRYPDPDVFLPERFLKSEGTLNDDDPADFVFGFGRRRCAGRHVADASIWIGIATLLATLDFNTAKDENGDDVKFEARFVNGLTHHPVHFPCNLVPRAHVTREALQRLLAQ